MKRFSLKLIAVMSCLLILATLSIFGQESQKQEFQQFNKKPLQYFIETLYTKIETRKVSLGETVSVTLEGYLTKDGKFDAKRSRFTKSEGYSEMVKVAKDAIEAIGDSGFFYYLQALGVEKVLVTLAQDEKNVSFIVIGEQLTAERAKTISAGFNGLIHIAKLNTKDDVDVQTLLNATTFRSENKNFILNFALPKEEAHRLLQNELQKVKQKSYSSNSE